MSLLFVVFSLLVPADTSIVVRKCCNMTSRFTNPNCTFGPTSTSSEFFALLKYDNGSLTVKYGVPNCTGIDRTTIMLESEIIEPNRTHLEMIADTKTEACLDVVNEKLTQFTCTQPSRGESPDVQVVLTKTIPYVYFRLTVMILSALSLLQLVLKFMKKPPTIHNRGVLSSSITLAGGYVFLVLITLMRHHNSKIPLVCPMTGMLIQFLILAHFFWLNVVSYDLWKTFGNESFVKSFETSNRFNMYSQYAWGCTITIVAATVLAEFLPYVPRKYKPMFDGITCFFGSRLSMFIYMHSFLMLIVLSNFVMFILIILNLKKHARSTKKLRRDKIRFTLYVRLSLFMGLSWFVNLLPLFLTILREFPWILHLSSDLHGVIIFCTFRGSSNTSRNQPTLSEIGVECTSLNRKSKTTTSQSEADVISTLDEDESSCFFYILKWCTIIAEEEVLDPLPHSQDAAFLY